MRTFILFLFFTLFFSQSFAFEEKQAMVKGFPTSGSYLRPLSFMGGKGESLYFGASAGAFYKKDRNSDWVQVSEYDKYSSDFKFFRDSEYNVYYTRAKVLYRIKDNNTAEAVYSTKTAIQKVIFEENQIVVLESNIFHFLDTNFKLQKAVDVSSISTFEIHNDHYNHTNEESTLAYSKNIGLIINRRVYIDSAYQYNVYISTDQGKYWKYQEKMEGTDKKLEAIYNTADDFMVYKVKADSSFEFYIYDTRIKDFITDKTFGSIGEIYRADNLINVISERRGSRISYSSDKGYSWEEVDWPSRVLDCYYLASCESGVSYFSPYTEPIAGFHPVKNDTFNINNPTCSIGFASTTLESFYSSNDTMWTNQFSLGIIKSTDRGRSWFEMDDSPNFYELEGFYRDNEGLIYVMSNYGLTRFKENGELHDYELDTNGKMNLRRGDIITIDDEFMVYTRGDGNGQLTLYGYDFKSDSVINYSSSVEYIEKVGDYIIFCSHEFDKSIKIFNQKMEEVRSIDFDYDISPVDVRLDSKGKAYFMTSFNILAMQDYPNGDIKEISYELPKYKYFRNLYISELDTMYLSTQDQLYMMDTKTDSIFQPFPDKEFKDVYILDAQPNGDVLYTNGTYLNGGLFYGNLYDNRHWEGTIAANDSILYPDFENRIMIESDTTEYQVNIKNYIANVDTTFLSTTKQTSYKIDKELPYQTAQYFVTMNGMSDSTEILFTHSVRYKNADFNFSKVNENTELRFVDGQEAQILIALQKDSTELISGYIQVRNTLNDEIKNIKIDKDEKSLYTFDIPEGTEEGIYKLYYSGYSDELGVLPDRYIYYIVNDDTWSSVEDSDKIITELSVFPTPAENSVKVQCNLKQTGLVKFSLYALDGHIVHKGATHVSMPGELQFDIDVSNLPSGEYQLIIESNGTYKMSKVLIAK